MRIVRRLLHLARRYWAVTATIVDFAASFPTDERATLTEANLLPEGVVKLSSGKKRHALLKAG